MTRNALLFFLFCSSAAFAQPVIGTDGIVSAASYLPSGFPNSGIAEGSIFVVFGSGMGPATLAQNNGFPLGTTLAGTSIQVTVNGTAKNAIMIYSSAGQVAAVLPSSTPAGTGTAVLTYNGQASNAAPIVVVPSSFGVFTRNQGGSGPAVSTSTNLTVSLLTPGTPGQELVLWGTGLGPVTTDETEPSPGGDMTNLAVQVYVGGQSATVVYRGRAPTFSGLDQINYIVPQGVTGCYVPVAVEVNGVISNFPSISVSSDGKACSDPAGQLSPVLQKIEAGENVNLGLVQLTRLQVTNIPQLGTVDEDSASGYFYSINPTQFLGGLGVASLNTFGACVVWTCRAGSCVPATEAGFVPALDAGSALSLTGPAGTAQIAKTASGSYAASLGSLISPYLGPGSYSVSGPGGSGANAVGPFSASQSLSGAPLTWSITANGTSGAVPTVSRSADMTVEWSGGPANGYVAILGASTTNAPATGTYPPQVTATFGCTAKGAAGTFTVPRWVLSALPNSGSLSELGLTVPNGFVLMGAYPSFTPFTATGLDFGFFTNLVISGENVTFGN